MDQIEDTHAEGAGLNRGFRSVFGSGRLSLGLVAPIESYPGGSRPSMRDHVARVRLAEALGFSAIWLRDVPFDVPSFGDAGQLFDPFVYLGFLAAQTESIALGVASIILPLRHPAHVAKAAFSADVLSGGRVLLGIASGDRPAEYPALDASFEARGARFRDAYDYIQRVREHSPTFENPCGRVGGGMDLLPKPETGRVPMLVTGGSQQDPEWLARHGDGWMIYPREPALQARIIGAWRERVRAHGGPRRPVMQPLYVDLAEDPDAPPRPIHLGMRLGAHHLREHLLALEASGVDHVALNLRFNRADVDATLHTLAREIFPHFTPSDS